MKHFNNLKPIVTEFDATGYWQVEPLRLAEQFLDQYRGCEIEAYYESTPTSDKEIGLHPERTWKSNKVRAEIPLSGSLKGFLGFGITSDLVEMNILGVPGFIDRRGEPYHKRINFQKLVIGDEWVTEVKEDLPLGKTF